MIDICVFIEARIGEDEAAAQAAPKGPWKWMGIYPQHVTNDSATLIAECFENPDLPPSCATHITRHDPARVLRECAARRRTLERHRPEDIGPPGFPCLRCSHCVKAGETAWPCDDAKDLASTWADHDDYQREWGEG